jgi:polyhydroxyalkanoate synthesis regulator phasin
MPKTESKVDRLARLTHEAVSDIREQMVTKADLKKELEAYATKSDLVDMEDRLVTHLKDVKAGVKQVIADEAQNTVEIARLKERVTKLERRVHVTK